MNIFKIAKQIRQITNEIIIAQDTYEENGVIAALEDLKKLLIEKNTSSLSIIQNLLIDIEYSLNNKKETFEKLYEYNEFSIINKMKYYFKEILVIWKKTETISYNDYLNIKIDELNFYIWNPLQSIWFSIDEEIFPYSYEIKNWKSIKTLVHPFGEEMLTTSLEQIFNNGSDYCDQDIASEIIKKIQNIQNSCY